MAFDYNYTTAGNVKVQNVVAGLDKRTGKVRVEFDIRGKDWNTADANYVEAKIIHSGSTRLTQTIYPEDKWVRHVLNWDAGGYQSAGSDLNLIDHGEQSITLRVEDEDDTIIDTALTVALDLDPVEHHLTLINPPSFGDDSTPDVKWSLTDLFSEQFLNVPTVIVGASTATTLDVTFDDDSTVTGLTGGVVNLNAVKFADSSLNMASANAGKAYFRGIKEYKITAPTMASGDNSFTIDLKCEAI